MDFTIFGYEINVFYLCSQLAVVIGTIFSLLSIQQRTKKRILDYTVIAAVFGVLHYSFLSAWSGALTKVVSVLRTAVADYETRKQMKFKVVPFLFVFLYYLVGMPTFTSIISMFPTTAAAIYTLALYFGSAKQIRYFAIFCSILWLIYDVSILSIAGIVTETMFIINDVVAAYRFRNSKKQKSRKTTKSTKHRQSNKPKKCTIKPRKTKQKTIARGK